MMPYPKVSAAEKYAEIGGRENAPKCECHKKPRIWESKSVRRAGGQWNCAVKASARTRRWQAKQKLAGLCINCGKPNNGTLSCDACRAKQMDYGFRWYHTTAMGQSVDARRVLRKAGRL